MREILFRGKRTDTGEWVEGLFCRKERGSCICPCIQREHESDFGDWIEQIEIDGTTLSQYVGLTDKNGKRIFEGDIVKAQDDILLSPFCYGITGKIVYEESAYFIEPPNPMESEYLYNECAVYKVIGNIHDNPELLER